MKYHEITKEELKRFIKTDLGGAEGTIYVDQKRVLKIFRNYLSQDEIQNKKRMIEYLIAMKELESFASIPQQLIFMKKRVGYWMNLISGVPLDQWVKQNKHNRKKVMIVYQKISEYLKLLHDKYGIIVNDCYYSNILIVDDLYPVFVDVDGWAMADVEGLSNSRILFEQSRGMLWNRMNQFMHLRRSIDVDNAALWLMYFESMFDIKIRFWTLYKLPDYLKENSAFLDVYNQISKPKLENIPYLHEVVKQYTL